MKKYKLIAEDTLKILEQGYYYNSKNEKVEIGASVQYAVNNTLLYTPEQLDVLLTVSDAGQVVTSFEVTNETTLNAARRLVVDGEEDILCLNFASAYNPGGGFLGGAAAQEESIARASALYPCLLKAPEYYSFHRNQQNFLYSDHMIWSPCVPVFKDETGQLTDVVLYTSIITSAAVNAGQLQKDGSSQPALIEQVMRVRINKMLALCVEKKQRVLILGAWGCGVFRNDPEMIARLFQEALTGPFANRFHHIVFAVKTNSESMLDALRKRF